MELRKAAKEDLLDIKELYSYYILNTNATWQRKDRSFEYYEKMLDEHGEMHPIFVAEVDGVFVGFGSLSEFRSACAYDRICENSIYLKTQHEGKGYGKAIMQKLLDEADSLGYWAMTAWIDTDNEKSIAFHEMYGFYTIGVMPKIGNKSDKRRSVTILQLDFDN